jgi:ATP-dependent Lhr-like helicase
MAFFGFHPLIARWFESRFDGPTEPQRLGWPPIAAGAHTLIAAPTGSGKTLTAFLSCIDRLLTHSIEGQLADETQVVYVSPLRALSNDMHRNLETPLAEIAALAEDAGIPIPSIRVGLRTGDTSPSQRAKLLRRPPHILVTTPESLYLLLTARKGRETLRTARTVIVDEIHALVRDKRGSHLALSLERLEALCGQPLQRIGLSATQKPIEKTARFLVGESCQLVTVSAAEKCDNQHSEESEPLSPNANSSAPADVPPTSSPAEDVTAADAPCHIVDVGHGRDLDLRIEIPASELGAVCMHEQWAEVNERVVELIQQHRSTLIFVNTRRLAERVTHQLTDLLGEGNVGSHHGSLSAKIRLETEQQLKSGELKAVVATASLELGLDIGYIDLVIQLGSPRAIATLLQRIGRSGHSLGLTPKGRLFALTRDELLECLALERAVRAGRLDAIRIPEAPLDVLAQQIVAEASVREWKTDELFALFRRADPYRNLSRQAYDATLQYLSEGITRSTGRSRVYLHHDQVGGRIRARRGAGISATSNAGAIPEVASYRVVAQPEETVVGTLDEDFAIESSGGDVFLLGNTSWRIQNVRGGDVNVTDARGAPPTIPFWRGEAPGRTWELSEEVSRLREELEQRLEEPEQAEVWLSHESACSAEAVHQAVAYLAAQKAAIGLVPTMRRVVFERFFDESGGMQLVVHAPFGAAINRAWGLAMRKRFCRSYDFELQASADDDGFVLSLGPQHSFPIESLFPMLTEANAVDLLKQALLAVPMFQVRWRWNVTRALLVPRRQNGKKVPPALQRFRADDLLTAVFPRLTGCQEEHTGDIELPDHPLVNQTMEDCLHEALDVDGMTRVLSDFRRGDVTFIPRDTREPSPFCYELLNANVYAFLDGGELQERRARAVATRRSLTVEAVSDLGRLDPEAIARVRAEAAPFVRNADELHDALLSRILLPPEELDDAAAWFDELAATGRAATVRLPDDRPAWVSAERLPALLAVFPEARPTPPIAPPAGVRQDWTSAEARVAMLRGLIEICGPITSRAAAARLSLTTDQTAAAFEALEGEGIVLRGHFTPAEPASVGPDLPAPPKSELPKSAEQTEVEWCHRRLLARIHRMTLEGLRQQIEPVGAAVFVRFLARHHGLHRSEKRSGPNGLYETVSMLQGLDIPAAAWERDILPSRLDNYQPNWLDDLCLSGEIGWGRLYPPSKSARRSKPMAGVTRVVPLSLYIRSDLNWLLEPSGHSHVIDALPSGNVFQQDLNSRTEAVARSAADGRTVDELLSTPARQVWELLRHHGAVFAADLLQGTQMLPAQLDDTLGELVSRGLVTADTFGGLRQLVADRPRTSTRPRRQRAGGRPRRRTTNEVGRWSLWRDRVDAGDETTNNTKAENAVEQWAWQLLRRWGVVFRDLLVRESGAPNWFELLQCYRRLEARGEIRGGRFVAGVAGEQFALGDSVRQLRTLRDAEAAEQDLVTTCAADPLNLIGIITDDARVPAMASNRVAYLDGVPVACLQGGALHFYQTLTTELETAIARRFGLSGTALPPRRLESEETEDLADADTGGTDDRGKVTKPQPPSGIPRPMIS